MTLFGVKCCLVANIYIVIYIYPAHIEMEDDFVLKSSSVKIFLLDIHAYTMTWGRPKPCNSG